MVIMYSDQKPSAPFISNFEKFLTSFGSIDGREMELLRNEMIFRSAPKNANLLTPSNVEHSFRFLVKGFLKVVFHSKESYVYDFRKKGDFLCDFISLIGKEKSNYSFITISNCEWIEIDGKKLLGLLESYPGIFSAFSKAAVEYTKKGQERNAIIRINNAEKRYLDFCESFPEISKNVKIGDIASYLDLALPSLSRIRKNILTKKI